MTFKLQTLLYIGLFMLLDPFDNSSQNMVVSLPIDLINNRNTIKYPIHVACECEDYEVYVDGIFVKQAGVIESYLENEWNATNIFIPEITNETPKIIAFHGKGNEFSGFMNGFLMDMNNGADYTKYKEWKCIDFLPSAVPINWYAYDYDDSLWEMSKSYGMNYQNNSYQIFETERRGIHLQAEWLWTQQNTKTNIFCRKKNTSVQTLPPATTAAAKIDTTAVPHVSKSVSHTTQHIPLQTSAAKIDKTAVPHVSKSVSHTTQHIPVQTAAPHVSKSVSHTTQHIPLQTAAAKIDKTAAPHVSKSVSHTTRHIPLQTAVPTAAAKIETTAVPTAAAKIETTAVPHVSKSVSHTTRHIPLQTAAPTAAPKVDTIAVPKSEIHNVYNINNNIKIIINNAKVSKNIIDKHISNILHQLDTLKYDRDMNENENENDNDSEKDKLYRELSDIVKQTHHHIHRHYDSIVDYYKKILEERYNQPRLEDDMDNDEKVEKVENGENDEKGEKKEIFNKNDSRLKKTSKLIESMIKLNHYIKMIEYKIHFIKGETRNNLFQILYSLRKQYQDDMIQMLKYL